MNVAAVIANIPASTRRESMMDVEEIEVALRAWALWTRGKQPADDVAVRVEWAVVSLPPPHRELVGLIYVCRVRPETAARNVRPGDWRRAHAYALQQVANALCGLTEQPASDDQQREHIQAA